MKLLPSLLVFTLGLVPLFAAGVPPVDSAPVDARDLLQSLKTLREQQAAQEKANKARFTQEAASAASNTARAVELWEEAVRATQFQGAARESAQFRDWKDKEGDALKDKEVLSALHLYFTWLNLTLQRASGTEAKTLLPAVFSYTRELAADQAQMEAYDGIIQAEKDRMAREKAEHRPTTAHEKEKRRDADATKKLHDQILGRALAGSAFVQWAHIDDLISQIAPMKKRGAPAAEEGSTTWEGTPGNMDGIYTTILLPEFRAAKDVRVLEYWDNKLRQETDAASRTKLAFDLEKLNTVRRPQILWSRAEDMAKIGFKNRAEGEMFSLIKTYPAHPDAKSWMDELEALLAPPAPAAAAASASVVPSASALPAP